MTLAENHALRAFDAVQLAAALRVQAGYVAVGETLTLVSADTDLNTAALAEGLLVEDPNTSQASAAPLGCVLAAPGNPGGSVPVNDLYGHEYQ
jgi:hypothetical protein